ncbi:MAG: primosomal protein N' [Chloroflexota bacterium]
MVAEVAVNLSGVRGAFHYHLPPELEGRLQPGHLVTVPFGPRHVQGVVLRLLPTTDVPETRPIEALLDAQPVLTPSQLELARWLATETRAPLIDCLTLMLPPGLSQQADSVYTLVEPEAEPKTPAEHRLLRLLQQRGPLRGRQIARALSRIDWRRAADALQRRGALTRTSILDAPQVRPRRIRTARLAVPPQQAQSAAEDMLHSPRAAAARRSRMLEVLLGESGPLEVTWVYAESGGSSADLRALEKQGLVTLGEEEVWRDPLADVDFVPSEAPTLTRDQEGAWDEVRLAIATAALGQPVPPFLLHGVTGSGKTEIYLRAVAETLAKGRTALVMVPEIALTPQTVRRFLARFPGQVGVIHSQLTSGERYDTWRRCRGGLLQVVVGARSALFAPLPRLGLIVLDEAHDESYKEQGQPPRYDARSTAVSYAHLLGAVCLLGSATPDVTLSYQAERGQLVRLALPQRILGHRQRLDQQAARLGVSSAYQPAEAEAAVIDLPPVQVIDMRHELRSGNTSLFSRALQQALVETVEAGQQSILFLNRRGTSTYVFCRDCGHVLRCPRCDTPLTYHGAQEQLLCHHCGYRRQPVARCPHCGGSRIRHFGAGTQRVEAEVRRLCSEARTLRWDWDVTRSPGAHDLILAHFAAHRADVLIGTQMIAKGLDLPLVTLVGVVSADTGLNLPDFRAAERTFQVLTQVSGRAGRGLLGGRVILQTYQPDHYAIRAAAGHDYAVFYTQEIALRRRLGYPPFRRLARLLYRHVREERARAEAEHLARALQAEIRRRQAQADLIGPAPCFFRRVRGEYRWQVVLRAADPLPLLPDPLPEGWVIDIDPVSLL